MRTSGRRRDQRVGDSLRAGSKRECERGAAAVVDVEERDPVPLEQRFVCHDREQKFEVSLGRRARQMIRTHREQRQQIEMIGTMRERVGLPGGLHEVVPVVARRDAVPPWAAAVGGHRGRRFGERRSRRPVAMSRPISSRSAVGPSTSATISPRYITPIRSDSSRTSSSSAETSRIAAPSSRLAMPACG